LFFTPDSLGAQAEEGKHFRQRHQPFGFFTFVIGKGVTAILPVEEILESLVDAGWQSKIIHLRGHFEFDKHVPGHIESFLLSIL